MVVKKREILGHCLNWTVIFGILVRWAVICVVRALGVGMELLSGL